MSNWNWDQIGYYFLEIPEYILDNFHFTTNYKDKITMNVRTRLTTWLAVSQLVPYNTMPNAVDWERMF